MKFIEALSLAASAIKAHKLRSFLTLLGIIFGVAVVIVVVSLIEGFNKYFEEKISDLGSNAFVVDKMGIVTSMQEWMDKSKKNKDIKEEDFEAIRANRVNVKDVAAMMRRRITIKYDTKSLQDVMLMGVTANMADIDTVKVEQGRYINEEEDKHAQDACFIGYEAIKQFFLGVDPIGREI